MQTELVKILNTGNQSAIGRIEKVRSYLEKKVGFDQFFNTYQLMCDAMVDGTREIKAKTIEKILGKNNMIYV